jgi:pilus assembly protein CpaB
MNRNRMLLLAGIALVLSAGVTYLAYRVLQTRLQPVEKTTQVVVANKKLELGARITKEDVQLAEWPKSTPLTGSFSDPALVVDRALLIPVQVNEPILESKLAPKEAGAGLAAIIPEGMRALSIQVNSIIGVAGFVLPGSRVDLILTAVPPSDVKGAKGSEQASKIILEGLEVIAAGQNVQRDVNGQPQSVQDVTLLLTPEQAEKVALATGDGRIQLALRNPMDREAAEPPLVVRSALYAGPTMDRPKGEREESSAEKPAPPKKSSASSRTASVRRRPPPKPPEPAPTPTPETRVVVIELIRGSNRAKQTFEGKTPEPTETPTLPDRIQQ